MSTQHAVRIDRDLFEEAGRVGRVLKRSAGAQIERWAQLGRNVEPLSRFDQADLIMSKYPEGSGLMDLSVDDYNRCVQLMEDDISFGDRSGFIEEMETDGYTYFGYDDEGTMISMTHGVRSPVTSAPVELD